MTTIRSLADELREKMRQNASGPEQIEPEPPPETKAADPQKGGRKKAGTPPPGQAGLELETLFAELAAYELIGNEKLLIRLDGRTCFLLKQLKIAKGVDMNKLIAFAVDAFFKERPELISYIKTSLQTIEL
jgi:hypothetical protein